MSSTIQDITLIIVIGTVLLIIFGSFVVSFLLFYKNKQQQHNKEKKELYNAFQSELLETKLKIQEQTFETISQEIHDNIGQLLSTAKMLYGISERNIQKVPDTFYTANETLGKAISELRLLSKTLSKEWLEQFNLVENLTTEINRINTSEVLKIHLTHPALIKLNVDTQLILFRILQEAIQNSIKHSGAKNIFLTIIEQGNLLEVTVKDDGAGFNPNETSSSVGLINMKHRTTILGGNINWKCDKQGTLVLIQLPKI